MVEPEKRFTLKTHKNIREEDEEVNRVTPKKHETEQDNRSNSQQRSSIKNIGVEIISTPKQVHNLGHVLVDTDLWKHEDSNKIPLSFMDPVDGSGSRIRKNYTENDNLGDLKIMNSPKFIQNHQDQLEVCKMSNQENYGRDSELASVDSRHLCHQDGGRNSRFTIKKKADALGDCTLEIGKSIDMTLDRSRERQTHKRGFRERSRS
jgi:hypothetical protein